LNLNLEIEDRPIMDISTIQDASSKGNIYNLHGEFKFEVTSGVAPTNLYINRIEDDFMILDQTISDIDRLLIIPPDQQFSV